MNITCLRISNMLKDDLQLNDFANGTHTLAQTHTHKHTTVIVLCLQVPLAGVRNLANGVSYKCFFNLLCCLLYSNKWKGFNVK